MHTARAWGLAAVLFSLSLSAQEAGNGLQVKPDPNCVVANGLPGVWLPDAALAERLAVVVGGTEHDGLDVERDQPVMVEPSSDRSQHLRRPGGRVEPHPHRREAGRSSSVDGFGRPDVGHGAGRQRQQA